MDSHGGSATVKWIGLTLFVLLLSANGWCADYTAPVVSVLDGDTIEVMHNQHPDRIRLSGIDCTEKGQAFGKRVRLQVHGKARTHPCRCASFRRYERQSHIGQGRLVLVVSNICTGGYGTRRIGEGGARV